MKQQLVLSLLFLLLSSLECQGAPTTYDHRQDGDVNVKVDLDNFVVLIARPISPLDVFGAVGQLLADTKNAPFLQLPEHKETELKSSEIVDQSRNNAIVPPPTAAAAAVVEEVEPNQPSSEQIKTETTTTNGFVQQMLMLSEEEQKAARSLEQPVLKPKNREAKDKAKTISKYKFVEAVEEPQSLKLVGESIENCGPGRIRDRLGICQEDRQ